MYQTTAQARNNKGLTSHKPAPQINLRYENTLRIEQRYKTPCKYPGVSSSAMRTRHLLCPYLFLLLQLRCFRPYAMLLPL